MNLLDRLERTIERVMEGSVNRVFRQSIQPAEIGRKLEHAMMENQRISMGSAIVPNDYLVELHPKDYAQIATYTHGLARQMESWLAEVAGEHGCTVIDRIRVRFEPSDRAGVHAPRVQATISDLFTGAVGNGYEPPRSSRQATEVFRPAVSASRQSSFKLRLLSGADSGREVEIGLGHVTIGRSAENDVVLETPDVSRRHARIEWKGNRLRVVDLSSTNGTRVNGTPVSVSELSPGDEIAFGGQRTLLIGSDGARFAAPVERF